MTWWSAPWGPGLLSELLRKGEFMEGKRDGFLFYRSYYEAVKELNKRDKTAAIMAICEYALNGIEPELSGAAASVWILVKPVIDANNRRYRNGKKGGRPITKAEPSDNQTETKAEPNKRQETRDKKTRDIRQDNTPGGGPSLSEVEDFCLGIGGDSAVAAAFYSQYAKTGWRANGQPIENWRGLLTSFVRNGGGQGGKGGQAPQPSAQNERVRKNLEQMRRILEEDEADEE